jgi:hypothetical protein
LIDRGEEDRGFDDGSDEDEDSEDEGEVDFLEEPDEDEEEGEEGGGEVAGMKNVNRADFLSATEIRHLTAAFETCDKEETGELGFEPFMKCLAVMGKKITVEEGKVRGGGDVSCLVAFVLALTCV